MNPIIEKKIWEYLDGTCTQSEREETERLLETNPEYQHIYRELKQLNEVFQTIELDEPSMSFTKNLMEKVKAGPVPGSVSSLIDKRIIRAISGFFIVTIAVLLVVMLFQITPSDSSNASSFTLPEFRMPEELLSSGLLKGFFFLDIVIGLYFLDTLLRRRLKHHEE